MTKMPILNVSKRTQFGRKIKQLRVQGKIPGNVFGKSIPSFAITLDPDSFTKIFKIAGETSIIDLQVEGVAKSHPVLISNRQRHPVTNRILHVDFHEVSLTEKVTVSVPLEFVGESPAVKEKGGILVTVIHEIEVEALPTELPDKFTVDLATLKDIGNSLTLKDLQLDQHKYSVSLAADATLVTIQSPKEEEVAPAPAVAEAVAAPTEGVPVPATNAKPPETPSTGNK